MPEKEITELSKLEYTSPELEYIWKYAAEYMPDEFKTKDGTVLLGESQIPYDFIDRYNDSKQQQPSRTLPLKEPFTFDKYLNNKAICSALDNLKLDKQKFWYLFLFIYDIISGCSKEGWQLIDSGKQINEFIASFEKFIEENPNQKMKLTLKSEYQIGVIKDISTIQHIIKYCKQGLEEESKKRIVQGFQAFEDSKSKLEYFFAKEMVLFFQCMNPDREIKVSDLEKALIVYLLQSAGLITSKLTPKYNKKYLSDPVKNYFQGLMNQYKDIKIPSLNNHYHF